MSDARANPVKLSESAGRAAQSPAAIEGGRRPAESHGSGPPSLSGILLIILICVVVDPAVFGRLLSSDGRINSGPIIQSIIALRAGLVLVALPYCLNINKYKNKFLVFAAGSELEAGLLGHRPFAQAGGFYQWLVLGILFAAGSELGARLLGHRRFVQAKRFYQKIEPDRPLVVPDEKLGYKYAPGKYQVTLRHNYVFAITHRADGLRVTGPLDADRGRRSGKSIWFLGSSYTHGWSVNDDETFPWLVRARLEEFGVDVVNFGVGGYGDLQSYIQLREALAGGARRPSLVVLSYGSCHDHRSTYSRVWEKATANPMHLRIPYARIDGDGVAIYERVMGYKGLPLIKFSAFLNFVDDVWIGLEQRKLDSHNVSKIIINNISELCRENGVEFALAAFSDDDLTREMLDHCGRKKIRVFDITIDLNEPGMSNMPYDAHPSKRAHAEYAKKVCDFLLASHLISE
jgi:hypothetical protein